MKGLYKLHLPHLTQYWLQSQLECGYPLSLMNICQLVPWSSVWSHWEVIRGRAQWEIPSSLQVLPSEGIRVVLPRPWVRFRGRGLVKNEPEPWLTLSSCHAVSEASTVCRHSPHHAPPTKMEDNQGPFSRAWTSSLLNYEVNRHSFLISIGLRRFFSIT